MCRAVLDVVEPTPDRPLIQPAGHCRDGHPERLRRLDRVDAPHLPRGDLILRLHPHNDRGTGGGRRGTGAAGRRDGSRAACSATASAPATSTWSPRAATCSPRASTRMIDFSEHRRDPADGRVLQPAAGPRAPPVRGRPGLHRVLRLPPGRDQQGLRRAGRRRGRGRGAGRAAPGGAVPADRPEGPGPHLRGRDPGQLAVRQGRRRVHHEDRAPARPAAPAADRVLRRGPAGHRPRRRRGRAGQDVADLRHALPGGAPAPAGGHAGPVRTPTMDGKVEIEAEVGTAAIGATLPPSATARSTRTSTPGSSSTSRPGCWTTHEHAMSSGEDARAAAYVECEVDGRTVWGAGLDSGHRHRLHKGSPGRSTAPAAEVRGYALAVRKAIARGPSERHRRRAGALCAAWPVRRSLCQRSRPPVSAVITDWSRTRYISCR